MAQQPITFRIFFACVGNAARSVMAEGFCRALSVPNVECKSGGSRPAGRLQPNAIAVMQERGIDISRYESKPIDEAFAANCDLIVLMGCAHDACPAFTGKTVEDWELPDPKGAPIEGVREIRDAIERRVRTVLSNRRLLRPAA